MPRELPYQENLEPLCPVHLNTMSAVKMEPLTFKCSTDACELHWARHDGYFYSESENVAKRSMAAQYLKLAIALEHGYYYLASVDSGRKTWACSVKDCENKTIENY
jgi:hypothetical protein